MRRTLRTGATVAGLVVSSFGFASTPAAGQEIVRETVTTARDAACIDGEGNGFVDCDSLIETIVTLRDGAEDLIAKAPVVVRFVSCLVPEPDNPDC